VNENYDLKNKIFNKLTECTEQGTTLASNTSSISITRLAGGLQDQSRAQDVIGMHFMNPVPVMKLVEVIKGLQTSEETVQRTEELAVVQMKKEISLSEDIPGFVVNRVLMPYINEAVYVLHEGIASIEDIDKGMKLGTNVPMGPLTLADFIGLDTCLAIMRVMHEGLGDSKYRPCPLLVNYVNAGYLGKKSGRGFYDYSKK
jgi:3-hydroxybutyryl-CoA dehydrogenase